MRNVSFVCRAYTTKFSYKRYDPIPQCWLLGDVLLLQCQCSFPRGYALTRLPLDKMAAIPQTIYSDAFSWMKSFVFLFQISLKYVPNGLIDNNLALV